MTTVEGVPLPERVRLFHIGPPKTATTAVQNAAAARRATLLEHGVRYPGRARSQRSAVAAFVGRRIGWAAEPPDMRHWDELMAEVEAETSRRVLFGHEFAAGADDAAARRFAEAIGPRTHVVVTLRSYGAMLPSIWQEHAKAGSSRPFDAWLEEVLARPRPPQTVERFHVRHDHGGLVRRWAAAVGPENVTVVALDPAHPRFVVEAFEALLGLPDGLLGDPDAGGSANRGLSVPEIELFRRLNAGLQPHTVPWADYERLVARGAAARLLAERRPAEREPRLRLPDWAADRADEEAKRHIAEIAETGVRVLGDLPALAQPAARRGVGLDENHEAVEQVPVEVAVRTLEGLVSAALGRGADFGASAAARPVAERRVCDVTTRDLLGVVVGRVRRRARSVRGRR